MGAPQPRRSSTGAMFGCVCVQSVRPPYRLGWLDSVVVSQDSHTGALLLGDPLPEQRDGHSSAGVYLGNMFVTEVTRRLKQRGVPVRPPPPCRPPPPAPRYRLIFSIYADRCQIRCRAASEAASRHGPGGDCVLVSDMTPHAAACCSVLRCGTCSCDGFELQRQAGSCKCLAECATSCTAAAGLSLVEILSQTHRPQPA